LTGLNNLTLPGLTNTAATGTWNGLTFTQTVLGTSTGNITLNGPITSAGNISINAAATINLDNNITATGTVSLTRSDRLGAASIVNSGNNALSFSSTINGAYSLTTNSGTAATTFGGVVGGTTPLANLNITADSLTLAHNFYGTGTFTYQPSTASKTIG